MGLYKFIVGHSNMNTLTVDVTVSFGQSYGYNLE